MKNKKLLVLGLVPMFLLASCDKEISQAQAQQKAANIVAAKETTSYKTLKSTVELSTEYNGNKASFKSTLSIDLENYYVAYEATGTAVQDSETTKKNVGTYYLVKDNALVMATNRNGEKTYVSISTDTTSFKSTIEEAASALYEQLGAPSIDEDAVLSKIKEGKDLSGSMSGVFSQADINVTVGADYAIKYFSNSSSSFGVSMSVNTSIASLYTLSANSRVEWKDNLISGLSAQVKATVGENTIGFKSALSNKYNGKINQINLNNYTAE